MPETQSRIRLIAAVSAAAFVLLSILTIWLSAASIEADLGTRAGAALKAAHFDAVTVAMDGRTATLSGFADDDTQKAGAVAAVAGVWGIASVIDTIQSGGAAAAPGLYRFGAVWDGHRLSLTGFMPSRDAREETVTFARDTLKRAEIVDGLQVAPGPPDLNWQAIATAGIAAMKGLSSATLTIAGTKVTFTGVAPDATIYETSSNLLDSLPAPYTSSIDIKIGAGAAPAAPAAPPGYRFGAAYDGVSIALSGAMPSAAIRTEIVARLKAMLPDAALDDRTNLDPAAPDGAWADAVGLALGQFARSKTATLQLDGRNLVLGVVVGDAAARNGIKIAFEDMPAAYLAALDLTIAGKGPAAREPVSGGADSPAFACQAAFADALAKDPVAFASSSAKLPDSAAALIGKLADIAGTCPEARLEITGHTDASGREPANLTLSEQRAEAVTAALTAKGVDAGRVSAKGFGAARPIAANDNDAGKARNRRIEVIVRP
ncbi:Peptidoglycan-associated lipoprotein [Alphaproteobacteria bacterium SO-S41]|nr:Peptidoglycan-associated lipoprotein [Alphaproteobacteria bacterium SO-S41]